MEEIYIKYSKLIYHYLYSLTHDIELSEELMQETFYSALKGIHKFKGESKISKWLYEIAKNKWKDYLRKNNKIKAISLDENYVIENLVLEDDFLERLNTKNECISVHKSIDKLDENTREVFYLRISGNLTFKEIGKILGKSEEWARITFYRGKLKLKEDLLKNGK